MIISNCNAKPHSYDAAKNSNNFRQQCPSFGMKGIASIKLLETSDIRHIALPQLICEHFSQLAGGGLDNIRRHLGLTPLGALQELPRAKRIDLKGVYSRVTLRTPVRDQWHNVRNFEISREKNGKFSLKGTGVYYFIKDALVRLGFDSAVIPHSGTKTEYRFSLTPETAIEKQEFRGIYKEALAISKMDTARKQGLCSVSEFTERQLNDKLGSSGIENLLLGENSYDAPIKDKRVP